jgi:hypothetical protein
MLSTDLREFSILNFLLRTLVRYYQTRRNVLHPLARTVT